MQKRTIRIIFGAIIIFGLVTLASGCTDNAIDVSQVQGYADPITEEILLALNDGNHAKYCEHFDQTMKGATTEDIFSQTNSLIKAKIGDYVSKEFWKIEEQEVYIIVYYKTKFTKETGDVVVKVVFQEIEDEMYVSGLWFDSPKLREQ